MRSRPTNLVLSFLVLAGGLAVAAAKPASSAGSANGVAGSMPTYYDHQLFTINFMQLTTAQATLLGKNSQQNTIYMSDAGLPGGAPFISVIDAILADGFNPLWAEVQIAFTTGHTPRQLFSDDEIAAAAASGEITLTATNEMYRCSVIGKPSATSAAAGRAGGAGAVMGGSPSPTTTSWGAVKKTYR